MSRDVIPEPCPGCGAFFAPLDGPTHRYIGASAGCWELYTSRLAGEEPDPALLAGSRAPAAAPTLSAHSMPGLHVLEVDAYAAQHHGDASPQAVQSVAVHLLALHAVLRRGLDPSDALWARIRAVRQRGVFHHLTPPAMGSALTLRHLHPGPGATAAYGTVGDYVVSVYEAWATDHAATLDRWYERFVVPE